MKEGEVLKVIIDYPPSAENVPKSMKEEGQEVIAVNKVGDRLWEILIRKRK